MALKDVLDTLERINQLAGGTSDADAVKMKADIAELQKAVTGIASTLSVMQQALSAVAAKAGIPFAK